MTGAALPRQDRCLEHFPEKWLRFSEEEMLQYYDLARFLIGQTIPPDRKAR
jgi:hypothetical protein